MHISNQGLNLVVYKNGNEIMQGFMSENLYFVNVVSKSQKVVHSKEELSYSVILLCHKRYVHININQIKKLENHKMVKRLHFMCSRKADIHIPFTKKIEKSTSKVLALLHRILCGPMKTESLDGSLYFVTFIDVFSRKVYVYFIT